MGFVAGSGKMAAALYIVIQSRNKWWVDLEGRGFGPFFTREAAALEAKSMAQKAEYTTRNSEVLVPDAQGKYWVVWSSAARGPITPRSASLPAPKPGSQQEQGAVSQQDRTAA